MSNIRSGFARVIGAGGSGGGGFSNWFGNGVDGNLSISSNTALQVTEDTGNIFKQYQTIHIHSGGVLRPSARCAGMVLLCMGDCQIDSGGSISMDKMAPRLSASTETIIRTQSLAAPYIQKTSALTGGNGGKGANTNGGVGGNGFWAGGGYGGGAGIPTKDPNNSSASSGYHGGDSEPRPPVTISWPYGAGSEGENAQYGASAGMSYYSYWGAAGPGGGTYQNWNSYVPGNAAEGDAYGGGALWLIVGGNIIINGSISANGGNGGDNSLSSAYNNDINYSVGGAGGGGGGGLICVLHRGSIQLNGNITANGGSKGSRTYNGSTGKYSGIDTNAVNGSVGTIYIHQVNDDGDLVTQP